jgi:hypothetical protein
VLTWKLQGPAYAADLRLSDGRAAKGVVVAGRDNPRGMVVLVPAADGAPETLLLDQAMVRLAPGDLIELLLMQERAFGASGLPKPEVED